MDFFLFFLFLYSFSSIRRLPNAKDIQTIFKRCCINTGPKWKYLYRSSIQASIFSLIFITPSLALVSSDWKSRVQWALCDVCLAHSPFHVIWFCLWRHSAVWMCSTMLDYNNFLLFSSNAFAIEFRVDFVVFVVVPRLARLSFNSVLKILDFQASKCWAKKERQEEVKKKRRGPSRRSI